MGTYNLDFKKHDENMKKFLKGKKRFFFFQRKVKPIQDILKELKYIK